MRIVFFAAERGMKLTTDTIAAFQFTMDDLKLSDRIGSGSYGEVFKASLKGAVPTTYCTAHVAMCRILWKDRDENTKTSILQTNKHNASWFVCHSLAICFMRKALR